MNTHIPTGLKFELCQQGQLAALIVAVTGKEFDKRILKNFGDDLIVIRRLILLT